MACVYDLLSRKLHALHSVTPHCTVLEATRVMNARSIGAVVVLEGERLVGMFTERDVLRRVVARELPPATVFVREVMTTNVCCCAPDTSIEQARELMMHRKVRHLPVINDDDVPIGIISIGDLNALQVFEQEAQIGQLQDYLYGRA